MLSSYYLAGTVVMISADHLFSCYWLKIGW